MLLSFTELIGAMVAVFLMALCYEGLKTFREWLIFYDLKRSKKKTDSKKDESASTNNDKITIKDFCLPDCREQCSTITMPSEKV